MPRDAEPGAGAGTSQRHGGPDRHLAELYDLRRYAGELNNLIDDPGSAAELEKLKKELAELSFVNFVC